MIKRLLLATVLIPIAAQAGLENVVKSLGKRFDTLAAKIEVGSKKGGGSSERNKDGDTSSSDEKKGGFVNITAYIDINNKPFSYELSLPRTRRLTDVKKEVYKEIENAKIKIADPIRDLKFQFKDTGVELTNEYFLDNAPQGLVISVVKRKGVTGKKGDGDTSSSDEQIADSVDITININVDKKPFSYELSLPRTRRLTDVKKEVYKEIENAKIKIADPIRDLKFQFKDTGVELTNEYFLDNAPQGLVISVVKRKGVTGKKGDGDKPAPTDPLNPPKIEPTLDIKDQVYKGQPLIIDFLVELDNPAALEFEVTYEKNRFVSPNVTENSLRWKGKSFIGLVSIKMTKENIKKVISYDEKVTTNKKVGKAVLSKVKWFMPSGNDMRICRTNYFYFDQRSGIRVELIPMRIVDKRYDSLREYLEEKLEELGTFSSFVVKVGQVRFFDYLVFSGEGVTEELLKILTAKYPKVEIVGKNILSRVKDSNGAIFAQGMV